MGKVTIRKIFSYDLKPAPGFNDAKMIDPKEFERLRKEKLRSKRKEKIERLNL